MKLVQHAAVSNMQKPHTGHEDRREGNGAPLVIDGL